MRNGFTRYLGRGLRVQRDMKRLPLVAALVLLSLASGADAETDTGSIQWFGRWTDAKAEAARSGKPILLVAAAPHCRGISGVW